MDLSGRRDRSKRIWPLGDPEQSSPSARLLLAQISASFDWKETDRALFDSSFLSTDRAVGRPIAEAPACSASFSSGSGDGTGVARPLTWEVATSSACTTRAVVGSSFRQPTKLLVPVFPSAFMNFFEVSNNVVEKKFNSCKINYNGFQNSLGFGAIPAKLFKIFDEKLQTSVKFQ